MNYEFKAPSSKIADFVIRKLGIEHKLCYLWKTNPKPN